MPPAILYVAHYGMRQVQVLSPGGKLLARYPGGNVTTSNVAFGGPKLDQLFVTGGLGRRKRPWRIVSPRPRRSRPENPSHGGSRTTSGP